jgi:hypothetical protein
MSAAPRLRLVAGYGRARAVSDVTHIWISAHHWPPNPPVVRTYCGKRFVHREGSVLMLTDDWRNATCPECLEQRGQDELEAEWMAQ